MFSRGRLTPAALSSWVAMVVVFLFGLVVASRAGAVGAFLVEERRERAEPAS